MSTTFKSLFIASILLCVTPVHAQSATDQLSSCMVDNLNGKERKSLAKWIFFAIGAHPEIKSYSNVSAKDMRTSDVYVGALITRMLTIDCSDRLKTAYAADPGSLEKAFEVVGKVAMQELLNSSEVNKALTNYIQFADGAKINKILSQE